VRASLLLKRPIRGSKLVQRISLYAGSRALHFETFIDWVERQKLLKVAFPVDVNTHHATYDIAYGNMARPNHRNTSYDAARFEVPAHMWMDLSEGGYGVSLINDCKYGHEANGNVMRLSLLKGSIYPDPKGDLEEHCFTYCLYPHAGDWREGGTVREALDLNSPPHVCLAKSGGALGEGDTNSADAYSFVSCEAPNLTLEALKLSEEGEDVIVRLVERHNRRTRTRLVFERPVAAAHSCNLMEEREEELATDGRQVELDVRPYEIVTLRVAF
jgi:alpha-mannosidase